MTGLVDEHSTHIFLVYASSRFTCFSPLHNQKKVRRQYEYIFCLKVTLGSWKPLKLCAQFCLNWDSYSAL